MRVLDDRIPVLAVRRVQHDGAADAAVLEAVPRRDRRQVALGEPDLPAAARPAAVPAVARVPAEAEEGLSVSLVGCQATAAVPPAAPVLRLGGRERGSGAGKNAPVIPVVVTAEHGPQPRRLPQRRHERLARPRVLRRERVVVVDAWSRVRVDAARLEVRHRGHGDVHKGERGDCPLVARCYGCVGATEPPDRLAALVN